MVTKRKTALKKKVKAKTLGTSYDNMFLQAEFTNMDSETNNPWQWKKGQIMNRWTNDTYFKITKVKRYPSSSVWMVRIPEPK